MICFILRHRMGSLAADAAKCWDGIWGVRCLWEINTEREERKKGWAEGVLCSVRLAPENVPPQADMLGPVDPHLTQSLMWTAPSRAPHQEVVSIADPHPEGAYSWSPLPWFGNEPFLDRGLQSTHSFQPHVVCSVFGQTWAEPYPAIIAGGWSSQLFVLCPISVL